MSASPLEAYREPVEGPLRFVSEQIVLSDGRRFGAAVEGDEWLVRDLLRPVFERDDAGLPRFAVVYLELARGHWKSGGAAAVAITEAVLHPSTDVVIAAADRDQAAIVLENVEGYLARNPVLARSFRQRGDEFAVPARGSRVRVISSDEATSWGLGGTHRRFRVIADELTVWKGDGLWSALVSATGKVDDVQTIVMSNAGFDAGNSWQWRVREAAEREPWGYLFSSPGIVASWIRPEWVEQMRTLLPGLAFDRVILNKWTGQVGDFVTLEQWRRCVDERWRPQTVAEPGRSYYAGLDLGLTKDRTALAVVHVDGAKCVRLDDLQVWQGSRTAPVEIETIERAVVDAAGRFKPLRVLADPWQLAGSIQRLSRAGVQVGEFTFSASSVAKLSTTLYSLITTAGLQVFPDEELEREVLGLQVVQTPGGWRVDHRVGGYSDRVISLAMAAQAALGPGFGAGQVSAVCYRCSTAHPADTPHEWERGAGNVDRDSGKLPPLYASLINGRR